MQGRDASSLARRRGCRRGRHCASTENDGNDMQKNGTCNSRTFYGLQQLSSHRTIKQFSLILLFMIIIEVCYPYFPGAGCTAHLIFPMELWQHYLQDLGYASQNDVWIALALNRCLICPVALRFNRIEKSLFFDLPHVHLIIV